MSHDGGAWEDDLQLTYERMDTYIGLPQNAGSRALPMCAIWLRQELELDQLASHHSAAGDSRGWRHEEALWPV